MFVSRIWSVMVHRANNKISLIHMKSNMKPTDTEIINDLSCNYFIDDPPDTMWFEVHEVFYLNI